MPDPATPPATLPDNARAGRRRAAILALLFFATLINYVDRQVLSILKGPLSDEFGWSEGDFARLVLGFQIAYAIGQAGSGVVLDRIGLRLGFVLFAAAWSCAAASHAFATTLVGFGICRFLLGLTEAANWPAAAKTTGEWFAPKDRAFATGVWNTGSATGAVIAAPLVTWIAIRFATPLPEGGERPNLQLAFVATASLGAVWIVFWWFIYRPRSAMQQAAPPQTPTLPQFRGSAATAAATATATDCADPAISVTRAQLLRRPELWGLFVARFVTDPVWWFFLLWLPGYLSKERGLSLAELGMIAWIPFLFADLGSVLGGTASSWLIRRGVPVLVARKRIMLIAGCLTPFAIVAARTGSVAGVITCGSIAGFAHQWFASSMLTLPADLFRGPVVATCSGLTGLGATLGGILATIATGSWLDAHPGGYGPLFVIAGIGHPLAVVAIYALVRRREPAQSEPQEYS